MKEILKLTASLTLICAIAGAAMVFVSSKTRDRIAQSKIRQRTEKMLLILPKEVKSTQELGTYDGVVFFAGQDEQGQTVAYAAEGRDGGFGGDVVVLAGIGKDGNFTGILVSESNETPGIGSQVCNRDERKSLWQLFAKKADAATPQQLPPNAYLDAYTGKSAKGNYAFGASGDAIAITPVSGATISSKAVLNAVNRISSAWAANQQAITSPKGK